MDDALRGDVRPFSDPDAHRGDITIFHFALPSPMTQAFTTLGGTRVLQYHNITPAAFFAPYDPGLFRLAAIGFVLVLRGRLRNGGKKNHD